ncbi:TPA: DUF4135 domain-containing protein, partial [Staphylococcus aureus]|nr:DUF4135 domain-containing protein [Staphylococcus aureus]
KYTKGNILTLVSQIIKENPYFIKDKHLLNNALIKSLEDQILGMLVENSLHLYTYIVNNFKGEIDIHTFNENIDDKLIEEIKKELSFFYDFLNLRYEFYCNYINEFMDNLIELQHITNFNSVGYIKLNKGDSHRKGKFAIEISLDQEIYIYKPRNSNVEKELCNLLNKYKKNYGYKIYNFHNHSFCKFIEYKSPKDIQDIQKYFYNQGFISAILYFLSSSDNHYENIIINNTYPYYIDLECFSLHKYNSNYALRRLNNSIFQTNIFPFTMDDRYVNLSALTGSAHDIINPTYNYKGYVLKNNKYVEQEIIPCTSEAKNNVLVNGEIIEPINHLQSIKKGFSEVCDLILKNKINYNDLHAIFSRPNTIKRYIYRDTDIYYRVLKLMEEPYYLQSKEHAKLAISSIHSNSELPLIKEYEEKTLLEGDIPIYYIHGTSLVTGDGDKIENFFSLSLYDQIKEKVKNFTLDDKRNCLENIEKSLIIDYYNLNKKGVYLNGQNSNKHDYFLNCISNLNNDNKFYISFTNNVAKVTYINSFMYEMGGTILASNLFSKINGININARAIKNNTNENKYINSIDSTYGISSYIYYIYMLYKINNDDKLLEDFNEMLNILLSYDYEKLPKDLFGGLSGSLLILNKIYQDLDSKSNYKKLLLKVITKQIKVFNNIDFSKLSA